jgi:Na+-transporting NADH:ubiquinone oxidoreductase subunit C
MNTNSNTYTIVYASVMVVIVAFLLAFVSSSLKDKQTTNEELDKKKQILQALNLSVEGDIDVDALYAEYVKEDRIYKFDGTLEAKTGGFSIKLKEEFKKEKQEDFLLPVYMCKVNNETKYVVPVEGAGLWGPIWGYITLNADKSTVYGVYFNHKGETPGLGAEITSQAFKSQFKDKRISRAGNFTSIAIVKPGKSDNTRDYVNGISGGTITSQGVDAMLLAGLGQYVNFLNR